MLPYSLDLRGRVVAAYEQGQGTIAQVAQMFSVGQTFVQKLLRQKRETGSLAPRPQRAGRKKRLTESHRRRLQKAVARQPDATLDELQQQLTEAKQVTGSRAPGCRELRGLALPRKERV